MTQSTPERMSRKWAERPAHRAGAIALPSAVLVGVGSLLREHAGNSGLLAVAGAAVEGLGWLGLGASGAWAVRGMANYVGNTPESDSNAPAIPAQSATTEAGRSAAQPAGNGPSGTQKAA